MPALDDLAAMRAGPEAQQPEPQGPMVPEDGGPVPGTEPQYGDARAQGVAPAPADPSQMVQFGPVKLDARVAPKVQELLKIVPGLMPTAGHRTKKEQTRANPQETESYHLEGTAVDLQGKARDLQKGYMWGKQSGATECVLHNVGKGYHLHLAWDPTELEAAANIEQQQQGPPPGAPPGPPEAGPPPEAPEPPV